jgi:hypothetical protein
VVWVNPWFDRQAEETSFLTTISRVMFGHYSIRAHLERFGIVWDPICTYMINETVDHIIWECSRFGVERRPVETRDRVYKKGYTNSGSLALQKWAALRLCHRFLRECGLKMLEVQRKLEPSYPKKNIFFPMSFLNSDQLTFKRQKKGITLLHP